jgi:hypothetical protein
VTQSGMAEACTSGAAPLQHAAATSASLPSKTGQDCMLLIPRPKIAIGLQLQDLAVVVLLMLIPLLAPKEGAAIGFATISKALGCSHLTYRMQGADTVRCTNSDAVRPSDLTRSALAWGIAYQAAGPARPLQCFDHILVEVVRQAHCHIGVLL